MNLLKVCLLVFIVATAVAVPQGDDQNRQNEDLSKRKVTVENLPGAVVQQGFNRPQSRQNPAFQRIGQPNVQVIQVPKQDQGNIAVVRMPQNQDQGQGQAGIAVVRMQPDQNQAQQQDIQVVRVGQDQDRNQQEDQQENRRGGTIVVIQKEQPQQAQEQQQQYWQPQYQNGPQQQPPQQRPRPVYQRPQQQYQQPQQQYQQHQQQYPLPLQQFPQQFQQPAPIAVAAPPALPNFGPFSPFKTAFASSPFVPSAPLPISRGLFAYQPATPLGELYAKKGDLLPSILFTGLTIAGVIFLFQLIAGIFLTKQGMMGSLLGIPETTAIPVSPGTTVVTQQLRPPVIQAYSQVTAKEGGQTERKGSRRRRDTGAPLFSSNTRTIESIMNALQAEQCVERLLCELGQYVKSQENSSRIMSITRAILPNHLKGPMEIFEKSVESTDSCSNIPCGRLPFVTKE